jgi:delta 1-pyrroline-5-carboxylate dehydrogenase
MLLSRLAFGSRSAASAAAVATARSFFGVAQARGLASMASASSASQSVAVGPLLERLGISTKSVNAGQYHGAWSNGSGEVHKAISPINNQTLAEVQFATERDFAAIVKAMDDAKPAWAALPMPRRGEIVRQIGDKLRKHKNDLGALVSLEMGKILSEGRGEVQEAIDICDLAGREALHCTALRTLEVTPPAI